MVSFFARKHALEFIFIELHCDGLVVASRTPITRAGPKGAGAMGELRPGG